MANKIGWCDITLNPITGCTNFNTQHCGDYCYAAQMAKRLAGRFGYPKENPFQPTLHIDKFAKLKNMRRGPAKRIFLSSMSDWFCEGMRADWVQLVIGALWGKPHHFLVLTKRPDRIQEMLHCVNLPPNLWLGVSVTCQDDVWRIDALKSSIPAATKRFISFEPLHGPINLGSFGGVDWCIIGQESGNRKDRVFIEEWWLDDLCRQIDRAGIPIYLKNGMCGPKPDGSYERREEFPEGLTRGEE